MDFDEYDYLEKAVEDAEIRKEERKKDDKSSSRHHEKGAAGESKSERKSRSEDHNGDKRDRQRSDRREKDREKDREDRDHRRDREREKDKDSERERERDREGGSRERDYKDMDRDGESEKGRDRERDREKERERERERSRRSSSRARYEAEREMERERSRRSSSRARYEAEREMERERSRRSSSRARYEAEREMERVRSRERAIRERELEREIRERESRRFKDKKEAVEAQADPERDQRTVFAYQMPLKATERDVYEFFSKAGKVRDVRLIMDRNSRRSKGVGYIEFYDAMSVPMAIAMSGQLLLGQPVMVKPSEAEKNLVQSTATVGSGVAGAGAGAARKIYVGNLHFNINEEQLRQVFEPFGPVELVQLPLDLETGQCKGYGFVQFSQIEHAKAAQSLNGKLEIAGRIIKVSAVTDHVTVQETGANTADFDDDDGGGLSLNARSRAMLMQKLDRTGTASSIAESLGVPLINGVAQPNQQTLPLPLALPTNGQAPLVAPPALLPIAMPIGDPSECILLKNMFDPSTETDPDFDLDIKDDVQEECSKFGPVKHIYVDKHSSGHVYLRFDTVMAAASCQRAMHMRWFAGRAISATFMRHQEYEAKFAHGGA